MFSSEFEENESAAARSALKQIKVFEQIIGLRIMLQKPLEVTSQLPLCSENDVFFKSADMRNMSREYSLLIAELMRSASSAGASNQNVTANFSDMWTSIYSQQTEMEHKWKNVIDKWHARVNFGSEHMKSKLKVLNFSICEQVLFLSSLYSIFCSQQLAHESFNESLRPMISYQMNRGLSKNHVFQYLKVGGWISRWTQNIPALTWKSLMTGYSMQCC
jgi:hypothetical protein